MPECTLVAVGGRVGYNIGSTEKEQKEAIDSERGGEEGLSCLP